MSKKPNLYILPLFFIFTSSVCLAQNLTKTDDCFPLPNNRTFDWDVRLYDMTKTQTHAIPSRPRCQRPSDISRRQKSVVVYVYAPDFSEYSRTGYKIEKLQITTECSTNFFGSKSMLIKSKSKTFIESSDIPQFENVCNITSCLKGFSRLIPGESILYPKPEKYDCTWMQTNPKTITRFLITPIIIKFNSTGHLTYPILGNECNVTNSTICVHRSFTSIIVFPTVVINPCAIFLKLVSPGVVSWSDSTTEIDKRTYISVPEYHLTFWFTEDYLTAPIRCTPNSTHVRESSDGYLIGIASESKPNMNYKNESIDPSNPNFLYYSEIFQSTKRFRRQTIDDPKLESKRPLYENVQRTFSRAELQWGLLSLHEEISNSRKDMGYEICKIRAALWDAAFTHLYDNPDLMARYLYPLDLVKGVFRSNVIHVAFGTSIENICIPRKVQFEGYYLKIMIKGQPYWLRSSSGELLKKSPSIRHKIEVSSFIIPTLPLGFYDILDGNYQEGNQAKYSESFSPSRYLFFTNELVDVQNLLAWDSDFQKYEARQALDASGEIEDRVDIETTFSEYVVQPTKEVWKSLSTGMKSTFSWILFIIVILMLLYFIGNVIIPIFKLKAKKDLGERKLELRQQKMDLERSQLTSF